MPKRQMNNTSISLLFQRLCLFPIQVPQRISDGQLWRTVAKEQQLTDFLNSQRVVT